jgi:hypothetical protein
VAGLWSVKGKREISTRFDRRIDNMGIYVENERTYPSLSVVFAEAAVLDMTFEVVTDEEEERDADELRDKGMTGPMGEGVAGVGVTESSESSEVTRRGGPKMEGMLDTAFGVF